MNCFTNLVRSQFLRKANRELKQAQHSILTVEPINKQGIETNSIVYWSFQKADKCNDFDHLWDVFNMDDHMYPGSEFLQEDYLSIVEDDEISILCSLDKRLVDECARHYHYAYCDWCYYRTKRKIGKRYVHIAVMWKAFPLIPFSVN